MQTIAASKMRRAEQQVLASRPYAEKAWEVLIHLAQQAGPTKQLHPLLTQRPIENVGLILITADRGLAGAYNSNMIRHTARFIRDSQKPIHSIAVGKRGRDFLARTGKPIVAYFNRIPDRPSVVDIQPIAQIVINDFLEGKFDEVYLAYTDFVNTLIQRPVVKRLLPLIPDLLEEQAMAEHIGGGQRTLAQAYLYEPGPAELLDTVLPRFTELQIYQAILEAQASEHAARMVAMRSATDNANELIGSLSLTYNRLRQESITKEMLDIVGGVEAQKQAA
jgi:F-type H+-transporting ATPase subunit gamma